MNRVGRLQMFPHMDLVSGSTRFLPPKMFVEPNILRNINMRTEPYFV